MHAAHSAGHMPPPPPPLPPLPLHSFPAQPHGALHSPPPAGYQHLPPPPHGHDQRLHANQQQRTDFPPLLPAIEHGAQQQQRRINSPPSASTAPPQSSASAADEDKQKQSSASAAGSDKAGQAKQQLQSSPPAQLQQPNAAPLQPLPVPVKPLGIEDTLVGSSSSPSAFGSSSSSSSLSAPSSISFSSLPLSSAAGASSSSAPSSSTSSSSSSPALSPAAAAHLLKKNRRKRGPKWTVQQTNDLLDALNAYVQDKGYPSSSDSGKTDEWTVICREAGQELRFTGYQACNRVSNLRKDFNNYMLTTHLRFLSDAPLIAREVALAQFPHATDKLRQEKEADILQSLRQHTRLTEDWCSLLELEPGCLFHDDVEKHLQAAKQRNADLFSYHSRFKQICDNMRAHSQQAGDKRRWKQKRKTEEMAAAAAAGQQQQQQGGAGSAVGDGLLSGGDGEVDGDSEHVGGLSIGDELDGSDVLPPMDGEGDGDDDVKLEHHHHSDSLPQLDQQHDAAGKKLKPDSSLFSLSPAELLSERLEAGSDRKRRRVTNERGDAAAADDAGRHPGPEEEPAGEAGGGLPQQGRLV